MDDKKLTIKSAEFWSNFNDWIDFFKLNIEIFAEMYFGLVLHDYQKMIMHNMNDPSLESLIFFASRGAAKSWISMVFAICKATLYPGIKICLVAPTQKQSTLLVKKVNDLKKDFINIAREIDDISVGKEEAKIVFKNGSEVFTVVCGESARGIRANIIIADEFALMDKETIDSIFVYMLTAKRHPPYLKNPKYKSYKEKENNCIIYLSSIRTKEEWSYKEFENYCRYIANGQKGYKVFSIPYQIPMSCGVVDRKLIERQMRESNIDPRIFQMEMEVRPLSENEFSIFKYNELEKSRILKIPVYPLSDDEYIKYKGDITKTPFYQKKLEGEKRVMSVDLAISSKSNSDNTVISVFRLIQEGSYYMKELVYMETLNGYSVNPQALRIKQVFYDTECSYLCTDAQGGLGIAIFDLLAMETYDPNRNKIYPAWKTFNEDKDLDARVKAKNALPVLFPIKVAGQGASDLTYQMMVTAKIEFENRRVFTLISEENAFDELEKRYNFLQLRASQDNFERDLAIKLLAPYCDVTKMTSEALNMSMIRLPSGRYTLDDHNKLKDRIISFIYGLYFISILELDLRTDEEQENDYSILFARNTQKGNNSGSKKVPFNGVGSNFFKR